jgi:hypothetical protein
MTNLKSVSHQQSPNLNIYIKILCKITKSYTIILLFFLLNNIFYNFYYFKIFNFIKIKIKF